MRIDQWLFFTRLAKTRTQAAAWVTAGHVRLNGFVVTKRAQSLKIGDEVLLLRAKRWHRCIVLALGSRRGPAPEARQLYEDLPAPDFDPWTD